MMLQLKNVSRRFGGVEALKDINFSIDSTELVGLIGPNGSGKSTLVNVISGVLRTTRGVVLFRDLDITRARTSHIVRLGITRNFQAPRLYWELAIRRNIEIAELEFSDRSELMHQFIQEHLPELKPKLERPARTLSLFEQKKLEIALRLASRPALVLLDEPAAGLSPSEQEELIRVLKSVNAIPCAVLVIEHSMSVIFRTCRRVLVLRGGTLIADDQPAAIAQNEAVIEAYLGPWRDRISSMILRTENLTSSYGDVTVVRNVSIAVSSGEVVAVLGANGAGKSTMVRTITNLHDRKTGSIIFDHTDITNLPPHEIARRGLALVPEHRHVFTRMSVKENLLMGGYLLSRQTNRSTLMNVFELFPRLQERARQLAGTLSGGEQQMLAIGRGLMAKPKLLILDEPSMGLAPLLVKEVYASLERLVNGGNITILLVEQNAREALSIAQRVYVMQRGEIAIEAKPDEIRGSLLNSYLMAPTT